VGLGAAELIGCVSWLNEAHKPRFSVIWFAYISGILSWLFGLLFFPL